ncbi:MAG: DNA-binding protein [Thermomicrobiales bacterium]|nr:MAG: DNA-binding protein [Thermomicrobiales bacterium]
MEIYDHSHKSMQELMAQETLTPKELATLLSIDIDTILTACFRGSLKAHIVDHDVVSIDRKDALDWMAKGQP